MSIWGIKSDYSYKAVEIVKETAKCVFYKDDSWGRRRETRADKSRFLKWRGAEGQARKLCDKLTSALAEYERRRTSATAWFERRRDELLRDTDGSPEGPDPQGLDGEAATAGAAERGNRPTSLGVAHDKLPPRIP